MLCSIEIQIQVYFLYLSFLLEGLVKNCSYSISYERLLMSFYDREMFYCYLFIFVANGEMRDKNILVNNVL